MIDIEKRCGGLISPGENRSYAGRFGEEHDVGIIVGMSVDAYGMPDLMKTDFNDFILAHHLTGRT